MPKVRSAAGNRLALADGDLGIVATRPDVVISPEPVLSVVLCFHLCEAGVVATVSLGDASTVVIGERVDVDLCSGPRSYSWKKERVQATLRASSLASSHRLMMTKSNACPRMRKAVASEATRVTAPCPCSSTANVRCDGHD